LIHAATAFFVNLAFCCNLKGFSPVSLMERAIRLLRIEPLKRTRERRNLMKTTLWQQILCAGGLIAGVTANAGPLKRSDVPAAPAWVLHVDLDSLRASTVGQYVLSQTDKPEIQAKLAVFQNMAGLDLRKGLHGLTLYGKTSAPEDGVLLVYGDLDAEKLTTLARAADDSQSTTNGSRIIYNWTADKKRGGSSRVYAGIQGSRVIVFGQRESKVSAAMDVLDGTTANLASTKTFEKLGSAGNGVFVQAAASKLDLPDADPNAAMFKMSKQIRFELGEIEKKVTAKLTLQADDEEVAQHIASIGQGILALMKLNKDKPEAIKIADALSLKQDGANVVGSLSLAADEVVGFMKADAERKAKKEGDSAK
jgi:hypothetical protein